MSGLSYCGAQVRAQDHDRFLACLFAPSEVREDLFALYAFNHEIAKTREIVSEPTLGLIRLQWWRDRLAEMREGVIVDHQVLKALAAAHDRRPLDAGYLETLIAARELDLDDEAFRTVEDLLAYAEATNAPLFYLALDILGHASDEALMAAKQAGRAYGLIGLLRAIPFHAAAQRHFLPQAVIERHQLTLSNLFAGRPDPALFGAVGELAALAETSLDQARVATQALAKPARHALYPLVPARLALGRLQRAGFNPFDARFQLPHPGRLPALCWAELGGRV